MNWGFLESQQRLQELISSLCWVLAERPCRSCSCLQESPAGNRRMPVSFLGGNPQTKGHSLKHLPKWRKWVKANKPWFGKLGWIEFLWFPRILTHGQINKKNSLVGGTYSLKTKKISSSAGVVPLKKNWQKKVHVLPKKASAFQTPPPSFSLQKPSCKASGLKD